MVSIGTLTAFIVVSIGVIILRVREPDLPRGFKVPLYPVTPVLSMLACGYILYSLHWYTWIAFSAWVLVVWASTCCGDATTARSTTVVTASSHRPPRASTMSRSSLRQGDTP